jgi:hypothetical protein
MDEKSPTTIISMTPGPSMSIIYKKPISLKRVKLNINKSQNQEVVHTERLIQSSQLVRNQSKLQTP